MTITGLRATGDMPCCSVADLTYQTDANEFTMTSGQACYLGPCPSRLPPVDRVLVICDGDHVALTWPELAEASDGYNVWRVTDKRAIADATPPADGVRPGRSRPVPRAGRRGPHRQRLTLP